MLEMKPMNVLDEIKSTEQKAAEIRREAQIKAREIVRDGERDADAAVAAIVSEAEQAASARLERAAEAAEKRAEAFLAESGEKDDDTVGRAEGKLAAAVDYIVNNAGDVR